MTQITIIQILGLFQNYSDVNYKLREGDQTIRCKFSSIAYGKLTSEKIKIIFFIPESIIIKDLSIIKKLNTSPEELIKIYEAKLRKIIGDDVNFQVKIIPSIGFYEIKKDENNSKNIVAFQNFIENIIIKFLIDLIDIKKELIIDISTGFNIYIHALIEAVRSLIVYKKLKNILQNKNPFKVKCMIVPPVIGHIPDQVLPIEIYDYKAKVFFDIPYKNLDINNNLISFSNGDVFNNNLEKLAKSSPKLDLKSRRIIDTTLLSFNAIKHNIPLAFFSKKLIEFDSNNENINQELEKIKDIHKFIKKTTKIEQIDNKIVFHRLKCLKTSIVNLLFTLGLYQSFKQFYEEIMMKKPIISNIRNTFQRLYEKIAMGSNLRFLERDLKQIEKYKSKINKGELIELRSLININKEQKREITTQFSDEKRNFFAHSGLQRDYIQLKKNDEDELELYYKEEYLEIVKKWLLNPEN